MAARLEGSNDSRLVGTFFGVLGTVSVVAISAAVIVSAVVGQPAGAQTYGMSSMTAPAPIAVQGSPAAGVKSVLHVTIAGSIAKGPDGKMHDTYTLVVYKAGRFEWFCALPCDTDAKGWAMSKPGFMRGYITAS